MSSIISPQTISSVIQGETLRKKEVKTSEQTVLVGKEGLPGECPDWHRN